jgi:hypothetical protein
MCIILKEVKIIFLIMDLIIKIQVSSLHPESNLKVAPYTTGR